MELKVFAIFDSKVGSYAQPFFMHSKGEAMRAWSDVVNDGKSAFFLHPSDYCLFELASYDDSNGQFTTLPVPQSLGLAQEYLKEQKWNPSIKSSSEPLSSSSDQSSESRQ